MIETSIMSDSKLRCSIIVVVAVLALITVVVYCISLSTIESYDGPNTTNTTGLRVNSTLKFVVVISRHGNRGPLFSFPNDPYPLNDTKYWPYGPTELTTLGRLQMYKLGMKVRSLYNGFLKSLYFNTDLRATTNFVERTMMSGETFLAGLYPPSGFQIWNKWIPWQPVPLYTDSKDKTPLVLSSCPRFQQESNISVTAFQTKYAANITSMNNIVGPYTGFSILDSVSYFAVWDTLSSSSGEGYALPYWTKQVFPEPMATFVGESFIATYAQTLNMTRLILGEFVEDMMEVLKSKVNGTLFPDRQIYYYSAHDNSIIALQVILGIPDDSIIKIIHPSSAMILELHQDPITESYTLEVLFIDGQTTDIAISSLKIPGCAESCDFNYVLNITKQYWENVDFERDCQLN